jgi:anti-sigma B factor antagonist
VSELEQPSADSGDAPDGWPVHDLLRITTAETSTTVVLTLRGELDMSTTPLLREQVLDNLATGRRVVIDATPLRFCGSTGLAVFVEAHNHALTHACELRIVIPPGGSVERVVDLVGLIDILPIAPDLEAALR